MAAGLVFLLVGAKIGHGIDTGEIQIAFLESLKAQGIALNPGKTVATLGVFMLLFPIVKSFFVVPLQDAINGRTTELEKTFSEVEALRSEMASMKSDYESQLVKTEAEARDKIQAQVREAQNLRQSLMADANAAKDKMIAQAQEEIGRERDRVVNELRIEVANLALAATGKLIGENMDSDRNRKLVNEFIEKVEVPHV